MEPGPSDTGLREPGGKIGKTGPMETGGQNKQNCPERAAGAKLGQEVADAAEAFTETAKATEAKRKRKPAVKVGWNKGRRSQGAEEVGDHMERATTRARLLDCPTDAAPTWKWTTLHRSSLACCRC